MKTVVVAAVVVVLVAVVGVGAFFAGSSYGAQQAQNTRAEFLNARQGGAGGQGGQFGSNAQTGQGGPAGRPAATGTVKSVNGNSLLVTQQDGSTVTVTVNAQTAIQKTVSGTLSDLQPGERITVISTQTGSNIVAQSIQLRPTSQGAQ